MAPVRSGKKATKKGAKRSLKVRPTRRGKPSRTTKRLATQRCSLPKGKSLQVIVNRIAQDNPTVDRKATRKMVKIALDKGVEMGALVRYNGRWRLSNNNLDEVAPKGKMLMTATLLRDYDNHNKQSHDEARKMLMDQLEDVETFISQKAKYDTEKESHLTDALELSMYKTVVQGYCASRQESHEKAVRQLAHYLEEADDVPRLLVGTMKKAKFVSAVRRRSSNN